MPRPAIKRNSGFSLVEVLVSSVIMSSGLAALAALLLMAASGTVGAADRAVASMLADAMVAQIRISPAVPEIFTGPPAGAPECGPEDDCDAGAFAAAGLARWRQSVAQGLSAGAGLVCLDGTPDDGTALAPDCDGQPRMVVKVFWAPRPGVPPGRLSRTVY